MGMTPWKNRMTSDRPRAARDFYETPEGLAHAVSVYLFGTQEFLSYSENNKIAILDPGCGKGVWGTALRKLLTRSAHLVGIDMELQLDGIESYDIAWEEDFTKPDIRHTHYDLIIGNPPYGLAESFVRRSMDLLTPGGYVYFLLQLNFLGSRKRQLGLFEEYPLKEVHVLTRRPSFFSSGDRENTTDANNYAMYLWQKGYEGDTVMRWLYWNYETTLA